MDDYFRKARKDERLRQPYLDKALALCPESVSEAVYDPEFIGFRNHLESLALEGSMGLSVLGKDPPDPEDAHFVVLPPRYLIGRGNRHPIFVSYSAFKTYRTEELFLSCLVDHEGQHCTDSMEGVDLQDGTMINFQNIDQVQHNTFNRVLELRAYHNMALQAKKKGLTHGSFLRNNEGLFDYYLDSLMKITPESELEERIISNPMIAYWHMK